MPVFVIPRDEDKGGWLWLRTSAMAEEVLQFSRLQAEFERRIGRAVGDPADWGYTSGGRGSQWFRVVLEEQGAGGVRKMPRFSLPRDTPRSALWVIARHLDAVGVRWIRLLDGRGESGYFAAIRPAMPGSGARGPGARRAEVRLRAS